MDTKSFGSVVVINNGTVDVFIQHFDSGEKLDPKPNISREAKRNLCSTVSKALQKSPEIG